MKPPMATSMLPRPVKNTMVPTCREAAASLLLRVVRDVPLHQARTRPVALEHQDASQACSYFSEERVHRRLTPEAAHLLASSLLKAPQSLAGARASPRVLVLNLSRSAQ